MTDPASLKQTPLHDLHVELGGKMVPFAGYALPVQYPAGIIKEHKHTRENASLFDVSHMGQVHLRGSEAAAALETLVLLDDPRRILDGQRIPRERHHLAAQFHMQIVEWGLLQKGGVGHGDLRI